MSGRGLVSVLVCFCEECRYALRTLCQACFFFYTLSLCHSLPSLPSSLPSPFESVFSLPPSPFCLPPSVVFSPSIPPSLSPPISPLPPSPISIKFTDLHVEVVKVFLTIESLRILQLRKHAQHTRQNPAGIYIVIQSPITCDVMI